MKDKKKVVKKYAKRTGRNVVSVSPRHNGRHIEAVLSDGEHIRVKWTEKPFYTFGKVFQVECETDKGVSFNKKEAVKCANYECDYLVTGYKDRDLIFRKKPREFVNWALEHDTLRETQFQPNGTKEETASIPITEMEVIE